MFLTASCQQDRAVSLSESQHHHLGPFRESRTAVSRPVRGFWVPGLPPVELTTHFLCRRCLGRPRMGSVPRRLWLSSAMGHATSLAPAVACGSAQTFLIWAVGPGPLNGVTRYLFVLYSPSGLDSGAGGVTSPLDWQICVSCNGLPLGRRQMRMMVLPFALAHSD